MFAVCRAVRSRGRTQGPATLHRTHLGAGDVDIMRGIILAAGKGSRLNGTAGDKPKCLVEAGGLTPIEGQMQGCQRGGVDDIVVVVGCQADRVRAVCGTDVAYVENSRFAETNSLYSL